jgi:hypothetical protein
VNYLGGMSVKNNRKDFQGDIIFSNNLLNTYIYKLSRKTYKIRIIKLDKTEKFNTFVG